MIFYRVFYYLIYFKLLLINKNITKIFSSYFLNKRFENKTDRLTIILAIIARVFRIMADVRIYLKNIIPFKTK